MRKGSMLVIAALLVWFAFQGVRAMSAVGSAAKTRATAIENVINEIR